MRQYFLDLFTHGQQSTTDIHADFHRVDDTSELTTKLAFYVQSEQIPREKVVAEVRISTRDTFALSWNEIEQV